ncbi:ImmA/IrrE family metallo-endopeptidase [Notoacmeibacter marinus]|nr:ImmA/IrrE family metallo-endopeptidase [Notoacmeibacter marinus]
MQRALRVDENKRRTKGEQKMRLTKIESRAKLVREKLGLEGIDQIVFSALRDRLAERQPNLHLKKTLADDMPNEQDEAYYDENSQTIFVSDVVWNRAENGDGDAMFVIAHELGHAYLDHTGIRKRNSISYSRYSLKNRTLEDEADEFASHFLVPTNRALIAPNSEYIRSRFGVSSLQSEIAWKRIKLAKFDLAGTQRPLPRNVINFREAVERQRDN